jgi:hypothetical protein
MPNAWRPHPAQALCEQLRRARGNMESRIKEQLSLFAAGVSASI